MRDRSHLTGALVTAAFVLLPIVGHGDTNARDSRGERASESAVDGNGNIRVPENYRSNYQFLGSWAVAADQGPGSKQLHVVFASPGAVEAYKNGGHFPDGSVLVKEVFSAVTTSMSTGMVSHTDALKGWFVMVRNTTGRYADNKLWGDGWGWAWFDADSPTHTTSTDYKINCRSCHVPAQASEWIYVGGYPPLRR
jgi:hypothetical protein